MTELPLMKLRVPNIVLAVLGIALAGLTVGNAAAQSFTATYDFSQVTTSSGTTDPTPSPTATGLTFGSFTAVGYTGSPSAGGRFSWNANPTGGINGSDDFSAFTGSLNAGIYYQVSLTPLDGYELDVDSISFTMLRSSTGIRSYAVRASVDGYAANLPASISPANANLGIGLDNEFRWLFETTTAAQNGSLVSLGAAFTSLAAPVTFRFYGWNAEGSAGSFSLDNVVFTGRTTPVPEPTTFALLTLGLVVLLNRSSGISIKKAREKVVVGSGFEPEKA